jgi:2-polyprenyl-3-methyl-5-hydroxy-6-metoxy-1,4-benzoquinol methylase
MSDKQWFETWFDTPYYHQLYRHRDEGEAQVFIAALMSSLGLAAGASVLDVACGKGRHSRYLASMGYDTVGIDLAACSIAAAREQPLPHLHYDVWDMRQVYRMDSFDCVVNLFSSLGYFDDARDDVAAIGAMAAALKPHGVLVIDHLNPEWVAKVIKPREIIDRGDIQFHIRKQIADGVIVKDIEFIAAGENHHYQERLKLYKPEDFEQMCTDAGLEIVARYGSYKLDAFISSSSERQIMICKLVAHRYTHIISIL